MPAFEYTALTPAGKQERGVLQADSARMARQQLRDTGLMPLALTPVALSNPGRMAFFRRRHTLGVADQALVTRQLATLIQSGIPVEQALRAVAAQNAQPQLNSMLMAVRARVMEGYTLADSLGEFPRAFSRLFRATVAAGEQAGHLDLVLNRLADYTEARQQSRQKIQLAAIYPIILSVVAIAIVVFLLTYVVPDIVEVFVRQGQSLPALTRAVLALSEFLAVWGLPLAGLAVVCGIGVRTALRQPALRRKWHYRLLHLPLLQSMIRGIQTARYASTLSILTTSGVPLVEAMRIAGEVLGNDHLRAVLQDAARKVSEGVTLHRALELTGYFPPMMLHMIASGETGGELDRMLERTADMQETSLQLKVSALVGLFEPLMLLVMGLMVLLIVLAIMLPILNMSNLVAGLAFVRQTG